MSLSTSTFVPHQAAERDWEEKRASLTQYSAQDINRLLEETQAELLKAIPDLDFAAKQIKSASNTPSQTPHSGTLEHRSIKPQHAKLSGKEPGSRRGSGKTSPDGHAERKLGRFRCGALLCWFLPC